MATLWLRLLSNIYGYFVVYLFVASWLRSLGVASLPFGLLLNTDFGLLTVLALLLSPLARKFLFWELKSFQRRNHDSSESTGHSPWKTFRTILTIPIWDLPDFEGKPPEKRRVPQPREQVSL